jgi:5-methylcytosine-specific restriction endonuclease McrA
MKVEWACCLKCRGVIAINPWHYEVVMAEKREVACKKCESRKNTATRKKNMEKARRETHTAIEWSTVCKHYGNICVRCKEERPIVKDHIIPVAKGGTDGADNLQPLCQHCNSWKKDRVMDFRPDRSCVWAKGMEMLENRPVYGVRKGDATYGNLVFTSTNLDSAKARFKREKRDGLPLQLVIRSQDWKCNDLCLERYNPGAGAHH